MKNGSMMLKHQKLYINFKTEKYQAYPLRFLTYPRLGTAAFGG